MKKIIIHSVLIIFLISVGAASFAHCDTRNGPVVKAAMEALRTNNVNLILIWVQPKDEAELKNAFTQTMLVRKKDKEAQQLADDYFFETAVRLHRMGEGEPFTGIKEEPTEFYILSAEKAIERKSADSILFELNLRMQQGLDNNLLAALSTQTYHPDDVKAGREYVNNYIRFLHYVEGLYTSASKEITGHREHEAGMIAATGKNDTLQQSVSTVSNTFIFLVVASLIALGVIMVFILMQNKRFLYQHHHYDLHNGMAQHLAQ